MPLLLDLIQKDVKEIVIEAFKGVIDCIREFGLHMLVKSCLANFTDTSRTSNDAIAAAIQKIMLVYDGII